MSTYLNSHIELFDGIIDADHMLALERIPRMYNQLLGPITALFLHRPELLDPSVYASACSHSQIGSFVGDLSLKAGFTDGITIPGGGKGSHLQQCVVSALAETAERLLAVVHAMATAGELVEGSYTSLVGAGRRALGPEAVPLFAPEQYRSAAFPYLPFTPDTALRWVEGRDFLDGEPVLVPAQLVLMHYRRASGEVPIGYPTSGGLAFQTSRGAAVRHGLCEVVERDAINLRWHCRLPPPRVDLDLRSLLADEYGVERIRLSSPGLPEPTFYLNSLDIDLPVFTVVSLDRRRPQRRFLGAGGGSTRRVRAVGQAFFELAQTRAALTRYGEWASTSLTASSPPGDMKDFLDATLWYGFPEHEELLSDYLHNGGDVEWDSVPDQPFGDDDGGGDDLSAWVRRHDLRPIVFDFGAGQVDGSVTKVFVPQLTSANQPACPYLGHPRYRRVPLGAGGGRRPMSYGELNLNPVPFP